MAPIIAAILGQAAPTIINGVMDEAKTLIDRLVPDKALAEKVKAALEEKRGDQEFQTRMAQIQVNIEEAKSSNWFTSGWRPAVGWIGAFSLGYAAIVEPFAKFIAMVGFGYIGPFPTLDTSITMQVLFGILGLGAYRTYEKFKDVEGNR